MKINKIVTIICTIAIFLVMAGLVFFASWLSEHGIILNIIVGVFSSLIVSCIISITGYFHGRNIILEKMDYNIKNLYINLGVAEKITNDVLSKIYTTPNLSDLSFGKLTGLAKLNIDFIGNMELGLLDLFYKNGKLGKIHAALLDFKSAVYTIQSICSDLEIKALEYSNKFASVQRFVMYGYGVNQVDYQFLDVLKNTINIKTAKFHEYINSELISFEKIAKDFYKFKNDENYWESIRSQLSKEIDGIAKI